MFLKQALLHGWKDSLNGAGVAVPSDLVIELISGLLSAENKRMTALAALAHPWCQM